MGVCIAASLAVFLAIESKKWVMRMRSKRVA
jgi:hypothetical protein